MNSVSGVRSLYYTYDEINYFDNNDPVNLFPFYWSGENTFTMDVNYGNFLLNKKTELMDELLSSIENKNGIIKSLTVKANKLIKDICNFKINKILSQISSSFLRVDGKGSINSCTIKLTSILKVLNHDISNCGKGNNTRGGVHGVESLEDLLSGLHLSENFFTMDVNKGNFLLEKKNLAIDELTLMINRKNDTIMNITKMIDSLLSTLELLNSPVNIWPSFSTNLHGRISLIEFLKGRLFSIKYNINNTLEEISKLTDDLSYHGNIENLTTKEDRINKCEVLIIRMNCVCNLLINV